MARTAAASTFKSFLFDENEQFEDGCQFDSCRFEKYTKFGNECSFVNCQFGMSNYNDDSILNDELGIWFEFGNKCVFDRCEVVSNSVIGAESVIVACCKFGPWCTFTQLRMTEEKEPSQFGVNNIFYGQCKLSSGTSFGANCYFAKRSAFGKEIVFGVNCSVNGDKSKFGDGCKFGANCMFSNEIEFGNPCEFGMNCSVGHGCVASGQIEWRRFGDLSLSTIRIVALSQPDVHKENERKTGDVHMNQGDYHGHCQVANGASIDVKMDAGDCNENTQEREKEKSKSKSKERVKEKENENEEMQLSKEKGKEKEKEKNLDNSKAKECDKSTGVFVKEVIDMIEQRSIFGGNGITYTLVATPDNKYGIVVASDDKGLNTLKSGMCVIGGGTQVGYFDSFDSVRRYFEEMQIYGCDESSILTLLNDSKEFPFKTVNEYKDYINIYAINEHGSQRLQQDISRCSKGMGMENEKNKLVYFEKLLTICQLPMVNKEQVNQFKYVEYAISLPKGQGHGNGAQGGQDGQDGQYAYGAYRDSAARGQLQSHRFNGMKQ